ncbi:TraB/GumN family protein, partial [Candidatus Woesearchaeota archaeon]|nr:TraB/GumN family protein [Candidatus Woesearchaeota archaeon]
NKLIKRFTWKEKFRFLKEIATSPLKKKKIIFDLRKVPSRKIIDSLIRKVKEDYPSVYLTLIEERNKIMGKHLKRLMATNEIVVAIVGAGHEEGIVEYLKENV